MFIVELTYVLLLSSTLIEGVEPNPCTWVLLSRLITLERGNIVRHA